MTKMDEKLEELCVNTIRMLSVDAIEKAKSGHPGFPMGAAPMAYVLWTRFLKHNPKNPRWFDRDRFVLSAGHGSMLLYSLLHLTGYDLSLEDIKNFRQWGSKTPGHPEYNLCIGVETTTGPLGQGFANGVGMAIAEQFLAAKFNRPGFNIVDHYTYGIVSDGDMMEGISHEAASLAGHLKLGKLIYLYDDNHISIEGSTDITYTEDRAKRFEAYGWHIEKVEDGNNIEAIERAIASAQKEKSKPSLILVRTHIGYGSPNKQDTPNVHGEPLGPEETKLTKENLGWPLEPSFYIPEDALKVFREAIPRGQARENEWNKLFQAYEREYPDLAKEWRRFMDGDLPEDAFEDIPYFKPDETGIATRAASGTVLNAVAPRVNNLMGGSADLAPSTKTVMTCTGDFQPDSYENRNLRFGVREHGMGSILNGMALHGGVIPYGATFLIFSEYMRPSIRLAAMMGLRVIYVFSHDSFALGEDGPTHQPVEQLASLRSIPNLTVLRPADANEVAEAWKYALRRNDGPTALILTRQKVPVLDRTAYTGSENLSKGAYVIKDASGVTPEAIIIGTGSELHIAIEAAKILEGKGINVRVVDMPSWELFEGQSEEYKRSVLPPEVKNRVSIEAGCSQGWDKYVGEKGTIIAIDHFGASAPYKVLYEKFGFTVDRLVKEVERLIWSVAR